MSVEEDLNGSSLKNDNDIAPFMSTLSTFHVYTLRQIAEKVKVYNMPHCLACVGYKFFFDFVVN